MTRAERLDGSSPAPCSAPVYSERYCNLYDCGYWDRYEGKPRPLKQAWTERSGWDDCNRELREERGAIVELTNEEAK